MAKYKIDKALEEQLKKRGLTNKIQEIENIGNKKSSAVNVLKDTVEDVDKVLDTGISTFSKALGGAMAAGYANKLQRETVRTNNYLGEKVLEQIKNPNISKDKKENLNNIYAKVNPDLISDIPELQLTPKEIYSSGAKLALTIALFGKNPMQTSALGIRTGQVVNPKTVKALESLYTISKGLTKANRVTKYGKTIGTALNLVDKYGIQTAYDALLGTAYGTAYANGENKSIDEVKNSAVTFGAINAAAPIVSGLVLRGLTQGLKYSGKGLSALSNNIKQKAERYALGTTLEQRMSNAKSNTDEILSIYKPAEKNIKEKVAGGVAKTIEWFQDLPRQIVDAGIPLKEKSRNAYLTYRLGVDRAKSLATEAKYKIANDIFSKDANIFKEQKAKLALLDQLDRARLGDKTALDGGDVQKLEERLIKMEQNHSDLGIIEEVQKSVDDYNDFNKKLLQEKVDAGLISKEVMDTLVEKHPNYIPHTVMADVLDNKVNQFNVSSYNPSKSTVVSSAGGSERQLEDPIQSIFDRIDQHYKALENSKLTDSLIKDDTAGLFIPVRKSENVVERKNILSQMKDIKNETGKIYKQLKDSKKYKDVILKNIKSNIDELKQLSKYAEDKFNLAMSPEGEVMSLSKQEFDNIAKEIDTLKNNIEVNLKDIKLKSVDDSIKYLRSQFDNLKATNKSNYDKVIKELSDQKISALEMKEKGLSTINRWKDGIKETWLVPEEVATAVKNLDQEPLHKAIRGWGAINNFFKKMTTGYNLPFAFNNLAKDRQTAFVTVDALINKSLDDLGMDKNIRKEIGLDSKGLVDLYRKVGGSGADIYSDSGFKQANKTFEEMRKSGFARLVSDARPDKVIKTINQELEKSTRLAAFKRALERGLSPEEAALIARDATVDFSKMGVQMKWLNQIVPFLNARVQGAVNLTKAIASDPELYARKMYYSAVVPSVLLDNYNSQFKSNDNVNENIKSNYWYFITGEEEATDKDGRKVSVPNIVAIKKGEQQQLFTIGIQEFIDRMKGRDKKTAGELVYNMIGSISPIGTGGYNPDSWYTAPIAATGPIGKLSVGLGTNIDPYSGLPIEPQSSRDQNVSPYLRYTSNNKKITKELSSTINQAFDGDAPSITSPARIEYILGSFGSVPKQILGAADIAEGAIKGEGVRTNSITGNPYTALPWVQDFVRQGSYIGSDDYKKGVKTEAELKRREGDINFKNKETANQIVDDAFKIKDLNERIDFLEEAEKNYPESVISKAKIEYRSRNAEGYLRPGMDTAIVSQFVYKELQEMGDKFTPEQKEEYLQNLFDKGIITKESKKEIIGLNQYGLYIDDIENAKEGANRNLSILSSISSMKDKEIDTKYVKMFLDKLWNDGFITPESKYIIVDGIKDIYNK